MSIYSSNLYKGNGVYNSGVYAGAGIYKTPDDGVVIGGKLYKVVKIGEQTWLAENLDFVDSFIVVGSGAISDSVAQANYYNNQEAYKKYGRLYNWNAVKYLQDNAATIFPGWRVPTEADYSQLLSMVGPNRTAEKLRSVEWGGTDEVGFGLLASGQFTGSGFSNNGLSTSLWTQTESSSTVSRRLNSFDSTIELAYSTKTSQFPIRLVKE